MAKKRVSLRDIADMTGLSVATVSRVVSGRGSSSEESRRIVAEAMRRSGYVQEGGRQVMPFVGLVMPYADNEFFSSVTARIGIELEGSGRFLVATECGDVASREVTALEQFYGMGAAGVVLVSCRSPEVVARLRDDVPAVLVDVRQEALDAYCVFSDDEVGGRLAARELLRSGRKSPIVLNNRGSDLTNPRVRGFLAEMREAGVDAPDDCVQAMGTEQPSATAANALVSYLCARGTAFDSVFACNDWMAFGALMALASAGRSVPEDVAVVGYDGASIARYNDPAITTVQQDTTAIGSTTASALVDLMEGRTPAQQVSLVPVRLMRGQTS